MPNITTLVNDLLAERRLPLDIKIVEHHEKTDAPARVSVMIYGGLVGLAVVTLERTNVWKISDIKSDNHYRNVQWPSQLTSEPNAEGARDLVDSVLKSVVANDEKKRA